VLYGSEHSDDAVFLGRDFSSGQSYSEKTAADIDDEIRSIISECYDRCKKYLSENIDKLHFIAEFLLKHEFMDEDQFIAAMETENPTFEQVEAIADERARKSEEENKTAHEENLAAEEKRKEEEKANAEAQAQNSDFLNDFFRDMQNGTLNEERKDNSENKPDDNDNNNGFNF
jgi:cell division protease FtsH